MEKRRNLTFRFGYLMARYPVIGASFLLAVLAAFVPGLFKLEITNDQDDLWVNKEGDLYKEQKVSDNNFGAFFRAEQVIFRARGGVDRDLIQTQYLEEVFWFQEIAKRTKISRGGKDYTIADLCWSALPDANCTIQTPLGYWQNNLTRMLEDKDPKITTQCLASKDPGNSMACMDETGLPVQTNVVFGGLTKVYNTSFNCKPNEKGEGFVKTDGTKDPCTPYVYNADALGSFF